METVNNTPEELRIEMASAADRDEVMALYRLQKKKPVPSRQPYLSSACSRRALAKAV